MAHVWGSELWNSFAMWLVSHKMGLMRLSQVTLISYLLLGVVVVDSVHVPALACAQVCVEKCKTPPLSSLASPEK